MKTSDVQSLEEEKSEKESDIEENVPATPSETSQIKERKRKSIAWRFFDKDSSTWGARCRLCNKIMSYRTGVSNLVKHVQRKHLHETEKKCNSVRSDNNEDDDDKERNLYSSPKKMVLVEREVEIVNSDEEVDMGGKEVDTEENFATTPSGQSQKKRHKSIAWKYFDKDVSGMWTARCRFCNSIKSYKASVSNLVKHVIRKHSDEMARSFNDSSSENEEADNKKQTSHSEVWSHFKCLSTKLRISMCLICNERFSSLDVSYLKKHLIKQHPEVNLTHQYNDVKNMLVSADGQLFEVESNSEQDEEDGDTNENDDFDTDTVYLDDSVMMSSPEPPVKRPKIRQRTRQKLENIFKFNPATSSLQERPRSVQTNCDTSKKDDPLEHFGTYLLCLMRKLPKHVSNQLQCTFVKLAMDAQLTCETEAPADNGNNSYLVAIEQQVPVTGTVTDLPVISLNNDADK